MPMYFFLQHRLMVGEKSEAWVLKTLPKLRYELIIEEDITVGRETGEPYHSTTEHSTYRAHHPTVTDTSSP